MPFRAPAGMGASFMPSPEADSGPADELPRRKGPRHKAPKLARTTPAAPQCDRTYDLPRCARSALSAPVRQLRSLTG